MGLTISTGTTLKINNKTYIFDVASLNPREAKILGAGGFGTVFVATDEATSRKVAIKFIQKIHVRGLENEIYAYQELSADPACSDYIVCLYNYDVNVDIDMVPHVAIVTELMNGNIRNLTLTREEFVDLLKSLIYGVYEIHSRGYAHHDLKPDNILYKTLPNGKKVFKIADLGSVCKSFFVKSNVIDCSRDSKVHTPQYVSPRLCGKFIINQHPTIVDYRSTDIWAMGVTLYETLKNAYPFSAKNCTELQNLTQSHVQSLNEMQDFPGLSATAVNHLVNIMLLVDMSPDIENTKQYLDNALTIPIYIQPPKKQAAVVSLSPKVPTPPKVITPLSQVVVSPKVITPLSQVVVSPKMPALLVPSKKASGTECSYYNLKLNRQQILFQLYQYLPQSKLDELGGLDKPTPTLCRMLLANLCPINLKSTKAKRFESLSEDTMKYILGELGNPIVHQQYVTGTILCKELKRILSGVDASE